MTGCGSASDGKVAQAEETVVSRSPEVATSQSWQGCRTHTHQDEKLDVFCLLKKI